MAIIGSSPLGLVGLQSNDPNGVYSKYNNRSRNSGDGMVSLFSGNRIIRPFPGKVGGSSSDTEKFDNNSTIHSNDIYNTTIPNIVDKLKGTKAELKLSDFAYLKDVGVYPNNRLMIARRFATPQLDNIMYNKGDDRGPLVTLISWKPQSEGDFLSISFGESWTEADASFTSILSEVGKDFRLPNDLGKYLEGAANAVPLPQSTEMLQRNILSKLGILDGDQVNQIPEGNPNLIKEAKRRSTVAAGTSGSGLKCTVSIAMNCTWEQKYIQGVDPTLAWMDIISMVGRFGTSNSMNYGLSGTFTKKIKEFLENPDNFIKEMIDNLKEALGKVVDAIKETFQKIVSGVKAVIKDPKKEAQNMIDGINKAKNEFISNILSTITKKYRERILGVLNNLSGMPSTPWHITLGNPLRPVFCSGDMYMNNDVILKFGQILSFNDLPTTITADFTLINARPWGLQEILSKFNNGHVRILSYSNDDKGRLDKQDINDFSLEEDSEIKIEDGLDVDLTKKEETRSETPNEVDQFPPISTYTGIPSIDAEINSDPNSEQPVVEPTAVIPIKEVIYTFKSSLDGSTIYVEVYLNGSSLFIRQFSSLTFTEEKAVSSMRFEANNFGFVVNGELYPKSTPPK